MALRQQFDTGITHFPQSNFKGTTIIQLSMKIRNIAQYQCIPILFVALILIPDFLNSYAMLCFVDVKSAQASSRSDSTTKEVISGASQLPTGQPADSSKGTTGPLDGSTGRGVVWTA
jgi:hypothetical protein